MNLGMHDWTVGRRITVGFVALGLVAATLVATVLQGMNQLSHDHHVSTTTTGGALVMVRAAATGAELYQVVADAQINRDFAQTRQAWAEMRKTADGRLSAVQALAIAPEQQQRLAEARRHYDAMVTIFEKELLPALEAQRGSTDATREMDGRLDEEAAGMAEELQAMADGSLKEAEAVNASFDAAEASTWRFLLLMALGGLIAACVLGYAVIKGVATRLNEAVVSLNEGAQQVVSAANQVAGSAQSLSQGATEQAASLEETSASMEEMASMTRRNSENTRQAVALVTDVHAKVNDSQAALGDMVQSMSAIQESSQKVSKIIKTIDEIAFQTNILALNAAVEAARAGEAGMGFAVVADEVRSLAQRSAQAAKDTAGLIEESIIKAQAGSLKVEQVTSAIGGITASVNRVKGLVDEVSEASHQQTQGIDQVASALSQMEKVTQGTAATAEESAAASEELSAQANTTMEVVGQLRKLVGVDAVGATIAAPRRRSAKATGNVVPLPRKQAARVAEPVTNEDLFPLEKTGTFGNF
ncbi:MAG: methyl-accepting chemotaxis protein [Vicinamibacterales bacterium]